MITIKPQFKHSKPAAQNKQTPLAANELRKPSKAPVVLGYDVKHPASRTPWPRPGGISNEALLISIPAYFFPADCFKQGLDVFVYIAGTVGLCAVAAKLRLPLFKLGATSSSDLLIRQQDLNRDAYAAYSHQNGQAVVEDESAWRRWEMRRVDMKTEPHSSSPVREVSRGLSVRLPDGMSFDVFEKELHRQLNPCALHTFARSRTGQCHFGHLGIDPSSVPRYVGYRFGSGLRLSLAQEIYICRPRDDWSRLRIICEKIIGEWLNKTK